jgi:hypothetical protein
MMKRLVFLVTVIFAAALLGLVAGCGKSNDQGPSAPVMVKDTGAVTLAGGTNAPAGELRGGRSSSPRSIVTPDGIVYEGEMKDGKPNGWGTLTDPRGSYQKGEWRNGVAYRITGTCVLPDGTKETGSWNNDGAICGGTIWYPDGRIYKGDWVIVEGKADLPFGMGAMTWPDGRQYTGYFVNGKMDGAGKMTYPDGRVEDGSWKQDTFAGPAK